MEQLSFPPEVLERIAPGLSLQRHLAVGLRPNLRNFDEFKPLEVLNSTAQSRDNLVSSSYVKNGQTLVVCNLTFGITEHSSIPEQSASVYPTISIARGRTGAPTDEEMNLAQNLHEVIMHSKILSTKDLAIRPGYFVDNEVIYPTDEDFDLLNKSKKLLKFNLYAHIKIFSRTGPLLDVCYFTLLSCLRSLELPQIYILEDMSKKKADKYIIDDNKQRYSLSLKFPSISSSFGITKKKDEHIVLCDLENESEEFNVNTKATVIASGNSLNHFSLINADLLDIGRNDLKKLISISMARSQNLGV